MVFTSLENLGSRNSGSFYCCNFLGGESIFVTHVMWSEMMN